MTINEFCKKHNVSRKNVDYWTNLGLIQPKVDKTNGYRDYSSVSADDIRKIELVKILNNGRISKADIDRLDDCSQAEWKNKIIPGIHSEYQNVQSKFVSILDYAEARAEE